LEFRVRAHSCRTSSTLKQISQVIQRWTDETEMALLLEGGRFRVALSDEDPAQVGAVFPRNVLPGGLAFVIARIDLAFAVGKGEEIPQR
jgi:hypothetical protein